MTTPSPDHDARNRRQVVYWRLLAAANGMTESVGNIEAMTAATAREVGLPAMILDAAPAVDTLVQRYPELKGDYEALHQVFRPRRTEHRRRMQPMAIFAGPSVTRSCC